MKFLKISLIFTIAACASLEHPKLDLKWKFIEDVNNPTGETLACLPVKDVLKINEMRVKQCKDEG